MSDLQHKWERAEANLTYSNIELGKARARIAELEAALGSIINEADELNKVFGRRVPDSVINARALLKGSQP